MMIDFISEILLSSYIFFVYIADFYLSNWRRKNVLKVLKMFAEVIGVIVVGVVCVIAIMVELFSNGADYE